MANFKTHCIAGVTLGITLNLTKQWAQKTHNPEREFDWSEMLAWGALGGTAASLPDLLEPATSPNHRSFFHSLAVGTLILFIILGRASKEFRPDVQEFLRVTGFSYLSHLALDIITPMGLPI